MLFEPAQKTLKKWAIGRSRKGTKKLLGEPAKSGYRPTCLQMKSTKEKKMGNSFFCSTDKDKNLKTFAEFPWEVPKIFALLHDKA